MEKADFRKRDDGEADDRSLEFGRGGQKQKGYIGAQWEDEGQALLGEECPVLNPKGHLPPTLI